MSIPELVLLGLVAGFTIFLGLPIGRLTTRSTATVSILNAVTIGILLFLLWDVLGHAVGPIEAQLTSVAIDPAAWLPFGGLAAVFVGTLAIGMLSLVAYDKWVHVRVSARTSDPTPGTRGVLRLDESASRLAFMIAVGIGLHNFSEGLAIGQSAAGGQLRLAVVLVVGFGLHNATEGFGITAPLAGGATRPSWAQLGILGLIGGLPTLIGTLLGGVFVNEVASIAFLALAAGSILFVIVQLVGVALKLEKGYRLYVGILIGLVAGFATDFVVTAARR
jgi:ZIP family zinc transporter